MSKRLFFASRRSRRVGFIITWVLEARPRLLPRCPFSKKKRGASLFLPFVLGPRDQAYAVHQSNRLPKHYFDWFQLPTCNAVVSPWGMENAAKKARTTRVNPMENRFFKYVERCGHLSRREPLLTHDSLQVSRSHMMLHRSMFKGKLSQNANSR